MYLKMSIKRLIYLVLLTISLFGCIPDVEIPVVSVEKAVVSSSGITVSLKAVAKPLVYDQCGFYISENAQMSPKKVLACPVSESFSATLDLDLDDLGTTLYYQAFVSKGISTANSVIETLKIPSLNYFVSIGNPEVKQVNDGSIRVTIWIRWAEGINPEKGICYSDESSSLSYENSYIKKAEKGDPFTVELDVTPGRTYYICGYVKGGPNNSEVVYGPKVQYDTPVLLPVVTTTGVSSVSAMTAVSGGNVTDQGSSDVTSRGIVWSTSPSPTVSLNTKTRDGSGDGSFTSKMTGLKPGTQYYVRAYATNSYGTAYGEELTFTTTSGYPVVQTSSAVGCSYTTADVYGEVVSDGGFSVSQRGFVWSTDPSPTTSLSTKTKDGSGTGSFDSTISGLTQGTKYYYRAYATNSMGTAYGEEYSFTTIAMPTVTTADISSITSTSAVSGGTASSTYGSIRARGVVWDTSPSPTVDLTTKTNEGTGTGSFTSFITGLTPGTTYFLRAYATCDGGTSYGEEKTFSTPIDLSTVRWSSVSYGSSTAQIDCNVISDGGSTVTARGVVWSTSPSPTVDLSTKTNDGTGLGTFTSKITGLSEGTQYYVRVYATNIAGTAYSSECSFTTSYETIDLSPSETANCYIVSKPGQYRFNALYKGNSYEGLGGIPVSADVLWESFGTTEAPSVGDIIESVSYSNGYVTFTTPKALNNGNAVIAVRNSSGTILWSWHIWVCEGFDPEATAQVYQNNAGIAMDRNLGATSSKESDIHSFGLLYQYGRKDPFLPPGEYFYDSPSYLSPAASSNIWPSPLGSNSYYGTISFTIQNPMVFITTKDEDWLDESEQINGKDRWSLQKSKYDPCPGGWHIPSESFFKQAMNTAWGMSSNGMGFDIWILSDNSKYTWYPIVGAYSFADGAIYYWYSNSRIQMYYLCNEKELIMSPLSITSLSNKAFGLPIRCVKQ